MELIKITGSKSWINGSGNKDSAKFGIFLCPVCKKEVEKSVSHGIRANSCGIKECRKETFRANTNNKGNTKDKKVSDLKYYTTIKEKHRQLCLSYNMCERWKVLKNFLEDIYEEYKSAREFCDTVVFYVINEDEEVNKDNYELRKVQKFKDYIPSDCDKNKYIYIVKAGKHTKIGITKNLQNRFKEIQTANPYLLELVFTKIVKNSASVEKSIHKEYSNFHILGEWFILSDNQINDIINKLFQIDLQLLS